MLVVFAVRLAQRTGAGVPPVPLPSPLPRVSILIAARNEEGALPRCLAALRASAYNIRVNHSATYIDHFQTKIRVLISVIKFKCILLPTNSIIGCYRSDGGKVGTVGACFYIKLFLILL